jgi:drug/metabolite transporter (DMT)-like permease
MVFLFALCAAICGATGAALQHREVGAVNASDAHGLRLLWASLRRPGWLLGFGVFLGAFGFQFTALKFGSLVQVQPVLTTELVILLGIIVITHRQRPSRRDLFAAAGTVAGLGAFLVAAGAHGGAHRLSSGWVLVLSAALVVVAGGLSLVGRLVDGWRRAAVLGAAAASCFAYQASMTKVVGATAAAKVPLSLAFWGMSLGGAVGFVIFQHALRAGHVAASRASMVVTNPLLSVVIGVVAFGESLSTSPVRLVAELAGLAVLLLSARGLATSPMITAEAGDHLSGAPGEAV